MSIISTLKDRELKAAKRSFDGREYFEKRVQSHAEHVKHMFSGDNPNPGVPVEVVVLRNLYYQFLENYTQERHVFNVTMNKRSIALWTRVEKAKQQANCSPKKFMQAQFDWFHRKFGKAPTPEQLATEGAVDRALAFSGSVDKRIIGNNVQHKTSLSDVFRQSEMLLQRMMASQRCSREEFYRTFVVPGLYTFPEEFLQADPVYQKVAAECTKKR